MIVISCNSADTRPKFLVVDGSTARGGPGGAIIRIYDREPGTSPANIRLGEQIGNVVLSATEVAELKKNL